MKYISAYRTISGMEFADEFSVQVYNNKADYKRNRSDNHGFAGAFGRCCHLFYKRACTQTNQGVFR